MSLYGAQVRLANGVIQEVRLQADNDWNARLMLEAQYGRGAVVFGPVRVG